MIQSWNLICEARVCASALNLFKTLSYLHSLKPIIGAIIINFS